MSNYGKRLLHSLMFHTFLLHEGEWGGVVVEHQTPNREVLCFIPIVLVSG